VRNVEPFEVALKINFVDGCACHYVQINIPVNFKVSCYSFNSLLISFDISVSILAASVYFVLSVLAMETTR